MNLAQAIIKNRTREARVDHAERILRKLRQRIFDYEDAGQEIYLKAKKVMETCRRILAPRNQARHEAREFARQNKIMRTME